MGINTAGPLAVLKVNLHFRERAILALGMTYIIADSARMGEPFLAPQSRRDSWSYFEINQVQECFETV